MRREIKKITIITILLLAVSFNASAKKGEKIWDDIKMTYPPATKTRGLETAAVNLDPATLKGFVVIMKGGIPAERAAYYHIGWGDYYYRAVTIEKNDEAKTIRGKIYTFLQAGDVMAVSRIEKIGRKIYIRLISPDIYTPINRSQDKHVSRVTVSMDFKIPSNIYKADDSKAALDFIANWIQPFKDLSEAKAFGDGIKAGEKIEESAADK